MTNIISEEIRNRIIVLGNEGKRASEISFETGVNKNKVYAILNGFSSLGEYAESLLKKRGFSSSSEYLQSLAKKRGFSSSSEYRQSLLKKRGFSSSSEYGESLAKKRGFSSSSEYQQSLAKKKARGGRYIEADEIRDSNLEKKELKCLLCGGPFLTDRCHRTCMKCKTGWKNKTRAKISPRLAGMLYPSFSDIDDLLKFESSLTRSINLAETRDHKYRTESDNFDLSDRLRFIERRVGDDKASGILYSY